MHQIPNADFTSGFNRHLARVSPANASPLAGGLAAKLSQKEAPARLDMWHASHPTRHLVAYEPRIVREIKLLIAFGSTVYAAVMIFMLLVLL